MHNVQKLFILFGITLASGAAVDKHSPHNDTSLYLDKASDDDDKTMEKEIIDYNPISPNIITLEDNKGTYDFVKAMAKVIRNVLLVISKIDMKEQTLRNLAQLFVSLVSTYWGPYSQIILPMLSGVAVTMLKYVTT